MFKAFSLWLDRVIEVSEGWRLILVLLALAVGLQWAATLFQLRVYLPRT